MSYNWKCCSFYPNNFDASALRHGKVQASLALLIWLNENVRY